VSGTDWILLAAVVVLFLASIWLALAETAFVRMNRIRAIALADEGGRRARRLETMLERPEQTLNVVLFLLLVTQLTSATLLGVLLEGTAGALGVFIGVVLQIIVFFVVGEVAPKTYAVQNTERAALQVTPILWFLTNLAPLRALSRGLIGIANAVLPGRGLKQGPFVTEEEIRTMADVAAEEDVIELEERRLIHSIFEFGDTVVREVMVPRPDMVCVEVDATIEAALGTAIDRGFSRLPACEGGSDNVVGLVYLKDLVRRAHEGEGSHPLQEAVRDAVFVPEQKRVAELLREMQNQKFHMAVVIDEHGGTAGLAHTRGPARGDRRRDHRRVRRRAPRSSASRRRPVRVPGAPDRRRERGARRAASPTRVGHRRRSRVQPPGHVPEGGDVASRSWSYAPSAWRAADRCRCIVAGRSPATAPPVAE
jgi:CBS domain containing-hemolysin-like protein